MRLNKKSYIFKFFKAYERFFTDQEKDDVMGEEILFLTREESEKRLFVGMLTMIIISSIFLLSLILVIILEVAYDEVILHVRKRLFEGMAIQKLYILYTNGHAVSATMNKDFKLKISQRFKLEYDHCSYFGFYNEPTINIYAASNTNVSYITRDLQKVKFIGDEMPHTPFMLEADSCQLQVSDYFWVIGRKCSMEYNNPDNHFRPEFQTQASVMFSFEKKKWIRGPDFPQLLNFFNANGLPLNRTLVLFVGVGFLPDVSESFKSNLVITYDLITKKWIMRDALLSVEYEYYPVNHQITSSTIYHEKNESRILVTSYVEFQVHKIQPKLFVWVSNMNDIKWTLIQVNSPSKIYAGNLVVLKGVLFYFNLPNDEESIGFQITIRNFTAEFKNFKTTGDKLYPKGQKEKWMEPLSWKPIHIQHKLLLIPYYSF